METVLSFEAGVPYDVLIIGGGPAGAAAAIYAARADLKTLVVDKGLRSGALGMTSKIVNYPGVAEELTGAALVQRMRQQAESFGAAFVQEKVLDTDLEGETKRVTTGANTYQARAVVIASGAMGRTYAIAGEEDLVGRGVSYCATCDGPFYRDEVVAVVGGNDEALEEALLLTRYVERVHLLSPTPELQGHADLAAEVRDHDKIDVHEGAILRQVVGDDLVEGVRYLPRDGEEEELLAVSGVFIYLQGRSPIVDFLGEQLPTGDQGCLAVDGAMQTRIPGVFAVGDVLCRHLKQAVIAAAEGVQAAMSAQRHLSGREKLRPDWS